MTARAHLFAVAAALTCFSACQTGREKEVAVDFSPAVRHVRGSDYPDVLKLWTRHAKLLSEIGTVLEVWAVLKSPEFREAYVEHYADVYHLVDEEREKLHEGQIEKAKQSYEFLVLAQSTEWKWNDFEKKDSAWRISLVDGAGHALRPSQVSVQKLPAPYEMEFFPYRTPFTRTYVIRFDMPDADEGGEGFLGPESGRLTLRFASPVGEVNLGWRAHGAVE